MAAPRSSSRRTAQTPASNEATASPALPAAPSRAKNDASGKGAAEIEGAQSKTASGKNYGDGDFDEIFALWRQNGDPELRDQLILMHRNLVVYLARRFADRGEVYEDIVQQGLIGLINALDNFDPKRRVRFATFATPTIIGEIRRYFRDKTWSVRVPRRLQELNHTINRRIESLTHELDRSPTYAEIASALGVQEEQVAEALEVTHAIEPASLDETFFNDEGLSVPISEQLGETDSNLSDIDEYAQLNAALDQLAPRQRLVLKLAYFEGFSQAEIAAQIKVSPMHVSRLQRHALAQLREILEDDGETLAASS